MLSPYCCLSENKLNSVVQNFIILNIDYVVTSLHLSHVTREYFTFYRDKDPSRFVHLFVFAFAKVFVGWEKGGPLYTGFFSTNVTWVTMTWAL